MIHKPMGLTAGSIRQPTAGSLTCRVFCLSSCFVAMTVSTSAHAAQPTTTEEPTRADVFKLIQAGMILSEDQAQRLELRLADDPDDLDARISLLGYYRFQSPEFSVVQGDAARHALWIIENAPAHPIAGQPFVDLRGLVHPAGLASAKKMWEKNVAADPTNTKILGNAARYFMFSDRKRTETHLLEARRLEPDNPEWPERLGRLYLRSEKSRNQCSKALRSFEEALSKQHGQGRSYMLEEAAEAAFCSQEPAKAKRYGKELLNSAMEQRTDWSFGNAVHHGNLILGRIALREGDVEAAEQYLVRAGKTVGSRRLNSYGPEMRLAWDLLKAGRSAAVLEYLELCKSFWKDSKLDTWIEDVKEGQMPNFASNLD